MGGTAFADVLDAMLAGAGRRTPPPPAPIATHPFFCFEHRVQVSHAQPERPAPKAPPAPRRILTAAQQQALDVLITLGARIDSNFTYNELRKVFRTLALRYHPDRHISSSDAEKARLAILFAKAHDAYERLKDVPPASLH